MFSKDYHLEYMKISNLNLSNDFCDLTTENPESIEVAYNSQLWDEGLFKGPYLIK